jgi:adenine/guanine/hypoxanthine permease
VTRVRCLPRWLAPGDWNAFFGLALDNTTQLVILSSLLIGVFKFPPDLVLHRMVPGTAAGVLIGDLVYTAFAIRLMRRTGRDDVTAMPFGIDTPSLFGLVFGVLGPAMLLTGDPELAWKIGMTVTVAMGALKFVLSFAGDHVRQLVPRPALLGSLAGVAALLIAFLPALKVFADPLVGLISLTIVLTALLGQVRLPWGIPGAFAAVLAGSSIFWIRAAAGAGSASLAAPAAALALAIPWPTLSWVPVISEALPYLSLAVPFALATVIGGIDNTESAIAAGDEYRARDILLTEAVATMAAGMCGGVIQNTPYIGHPAYKAMGARSGYTLATALVVGVGAAVGLISALVSVVPEAAVAPILVFIGLEITAQAFIASPPRYAPAIVISLIPATAALLLIEVDQFLAAAGRKVSELTVQGQAAFGTLLVLGNGFVVTALLWGWALVSIIDGRLGRAAAVFGGCAAATLFGLMHSPLPSGAVFWPWQPGQSEPFLLAAAYGMGAAALLLLGRMRAAS